MLLLRLKKGLEGLTARVDSNEIITFAKFLVLAVVILPVVPNRDLLLSAILGGAYSSTVTTVVLARHAKEEPRPHLLAGSILTASGACMCGWCSCSRSSTERLQPTFEALGVFDGLAGWILSRRSDGTDGSAQGQRGPKNPLELSAAFLFAIIFIPDGTADAYVGRKTCTPMPRTAGSRRSSARPRRPTRTTRSRWTCAP